MTPPQPPRADRLPGIEYSYYRGQWFARLTRCPFCLLPFDDMKAATHFERTPEEGGHGPEVIP